MLTPPSPFALSIYKIFKKKLECLLVNYLAMGYIPFRTDQTNSPNPRRAERSRPC